jgi:hypothetical protein
VCAFRKVIRLDHFFAAGQMQGQLQAFGFIGRYRLVARITDLFLLWLGEVFGGKVEQGTLFGINGNMSFALCPKDHPLELGQFMTEHGQSGDHQVVFCFGNGNGLCVCHETKLPK